MDVPMIAMGFGFGAAGGAILCSLIGLHYFETMFFFMGGFVGAVVGSGYFGSVDFFDAWS